MTKKEGIGGYKKWEEQSGIKRGIRGEKMKQRNKEKER